MAKIINGFISGKISGMIFCAGPNRTAYVRKTWAYKNEPTDQQLAARARMAVANDLLRPLRSFIEMAWQKSCYLTKTAFGSAFSNLLKEGFDRSSPTPVIIWEKVLLCRGHLQNPQEVSAIRDDIRITVTWENTANRHSRYCRDGDRPVLVVHNPDAETSCVLQEAGRLRRDCQLDVQLPASFTGSDIHLYFLFISGEFTLCSTSMYLGCF